MKYQAQGSAMTVTARCNRRDKTSEAERRCLGTA